MSSSAKKIVEERINKIGIKINGKNKSDIKIKNDKFYSRVLTGGSLAFGESYMDGWWDSEAVDELVAKILRTKMDISTEKSLSFFMFVLKNKFLNMQSKVRSRIVGKKHYDVGNELYKYMLDKNMNYTCAYWKGARTLDQAQENKLDLVCKKLELKSGMSVLDLGCGWANLSKFMAENYKVKVLGLTISEEQQKLGQERCKGLDVEIRLQDYREVAGQFDRVVSIGILEHIGYKNYDTYFKVVNRCLKEDGLSLIHTIGGNRKFAPHSDPWLDKYIFPNAVIPRMRYIAAAMEGIFKIEDVHNFGLDYDKTLMAWNKRFDKNWEKIKKLSPKYDERFKRMWNYYLLMCAAGFRSGSNGLWQIVFSKIGRGKAYTSVR